MNDKDFANRFFDEMENKFDTLFEKWDDMRKDINKALTQCDSECPDKFVLKSEFETVKKTTDFLVKKWYMIAGGVAVIIFASTMLSKFI